MNERPTPETDAMFTAFNRREPNAIDPADFARDLERQRDEARAEAGRLLVVESQQKDQIEALRKTLIESEAYQAGLVADLEAMREAIKEAYDTIKDATDNCLWRSDSPIPLSTEASQRLYNRAIETMENLQPFLKP